MHPLNQNPRAQFGMNAGSVLMNRVYLHSRQVCSLPADVTDKVDQWYIHRCKEPNEVDKWRGPNGP